MSTADFSIDLLILCGGAGQRMGGRDKGLIAFAQHNLVQQILTQVNDWPIAQIYLSANRHLGEYRALGYPVLCDHTELQSDQHKSLDPFLGPFLGPLAGIAAGLDATQADALLVLPCDVPYLPANLLSALQQALTDTTEVAVAADKTRTHPSICLVRKTQKDIVTAALARQDYRLHAWQKSVSARHVIFDFAFHNLNTPQDFLIDFTH